MWYIRILKSNIETDAKKKGFIGPEIGFYYKIYNFYPIVINLGENIQPMGRCYLPKYQIDGVKIADFYYWV